LEIVYPKYVFAHECKLLVALYWTCSGVRRAHEYDPNAAFSNGVEDKEITHAANEFVITIPRKSNQAQAESNQVVTANERKSNQAQAESNQVMAANECKSNQPDMESNQPRMNLVTRKLTKKKRILETFAPYRGLRRKLWIG